MSKSDESINSDKQTLVQHLTELRSRLIKSLVLICIVFVIQKLDQTPRPLFLEKLVATWGPSS